MKKIILFLFLILNYKIAFSQSFSINGIVLGKGKSEPISYVNIGIKHKNIGTVSNLEGEFTINIPDSLIGEKLTFSSIGYHPKIMKLSALKDLEKAEIILESKTYEIDPIAVSSTELEENTVGIKWSGLINTVVMLEDDELGKEFALEMECENYPAKIEKVFLDIEKNVFDPLIFRLNIYSKREDGPGKSVLKKPIIIEETIIEGELEISLEKYEIYVKNDFYVAFEWITDPTTHTNKKLYLTARMGLLNKRTWARNTSHGEWEKVAMANVVISAQVLN